MLQTDWMLSFGIGATFAVAAKEQIKSSVAKEEPWNKEGSYIYNIIFLLLVFSPIGIFNYWLDPEWETLFMMRSDMPPIWPALFVLSVGSAGILGYKLAYDYIQKSKESMAKTVALLGHGIFLISLMLLYKRVLYTGSFEDFNGSTAGWFALTNGPLKHIDFINFFHYKVFYALLLEAIIFIPAFIIPIVIWRKQGKYT